MVEPWLVCRTQYQHESSAAKALTTLGAEAWLPTHTVLHEWSDRRHRLNIPLFPGYCFVRWTAARWGSLLHVPGVRTVLRTDGVASVVPEAEMANLQRFVAGLATGALSAEPASEGCWRAADPVLMITGPLAGVEGRVVRRRGGLRLVIMLESLGEGVMVTVPIEHVAPLPGSALAA